jgi:peptidoglycan hydrolase-like protein with peptidoglycan-binding domain
MANRGWLIQWSAFGLLAISLGNLPAVASEASSVSREVAQATPSIVVNRPILKIGSRGAEVSELQAALKLLGYFTGTVDGIYGESTAIAVSRFQQSSGLTADGITGSATWARLFPSPSTAQMPPPTSSTSPASGFPVPSSLPTTSPASGFPVPSSLPSTMSGSDRNSPFTTPQNSPSTVNPQSTAVALPILREGMRGSAVAQLQERLRTLGFFRGTADGIFGTATQSAVKAAQQNFNLEPDGIVGAATWSALLR